MVGERKTGDFKNGSLKKFFFTADSQHFGRFQRTRQQQSSPCGIRRRGSFKRHDSSIQRRDEKEARGHTGFRRNGNRHHQEK